VRDPALASQVVTELTRIHRWSPAAASGGARHVSRRVCYQFGSLTSGHVAKNALGHELWRMTLTTSICKIGYGADQKIRSRSYARRFTTTPVGSLWDFSWTDKVDRLHECFRISGVRYCKKYDSYAEGHAKLGVGDAAQHAYPFGRNKYWPGGSSSDGGA
jgi:hypothetical protein